MSNHKPVMMTAKEMALTSHNLSNHAMTATTANGKKFHWSDVAEMWVEVIEIKTPWYFDVEIVSRKNMHQFAADYAATMTATKKGRELVDGYQVKACRHGYKITWYGMGCGYGIMDASTLYSWMVRTPLNYYAIKASGIRGEVLTK